MAEEIVSTARPSGLRLLGFVTLAVGALLAGIGATATWATVGFPGDVAGAADVPVKGTDVWEGKIVLVFAAAVLVALIALRLVRPGGGRSIVAVGVTIAGVVVVALTALDLVTAEDRFGGADGLEELARSVATQLGQPTERVRALLEQSFGATLRVDVGAGLPLALLGGVLLVVAGALALAWARREESLAAAPAEEADETQEAERADAGGTP
jgi:hypothetical protein